MLGQQCCAGGLCEDAPGPGEIYPQRGISPKDPSERIQRTIREALAPACPVHLDCVFTSPWPKLHQLAKARQHQEAGIVGTCSFWQGAHEEKAQGSRVVVGAGEPDPSQM
jgi:hypothetical protein